MLLKTGSVERIGKLLRTYSIFPGLDITDLFERILFNFIIGNSDVHLKNYSFIETPQGMRLSPAYDLLSTVIAIPEDPEESALISMGKNQSSLWQTLIHWLNILVCNIL